MSYIILPFLQNLLVFWVNIFLTFFFCIVVYVSEPMIFLTLLWIRIKTKFFPNPLNTLDNLSNAFPSMWFSCHSCAVVKLHPDLLLFKDSFIAIAQGVLFTLFLPKILYFLDFTFSSFILPLYLLMHVFQNFPWKEWMEHPHMPECFKFRGWLISSFARFGTLVLVSFSFTSKNFFTIF